MQKFKEISLFLVLLLFVHSFSIAQTDPVFDVSKLPGHPRILLLKGEENNIKRTNSSDSIWNQVNNSIFTFCDILLDKAPVERILTGKRLLSVSRECLRRILYLSYAWRMTHDEKYLRRAESEMIAVSKFSDWNPSHFLDVSEMTMALAIGYDWLYEILPEKSKEAIRESIIKKGLEPSLDSSYNWWLQVSHNWNQVCNAGMTYGVLAIYENEPKLAKEIIDRSLETIKLPMSAYNPDGNYPEGYGYWGYGTTFNVLLISAIEKAFNTSFNFEDMDGFLNTAAYMVHMTGPSGECFNYSDNSAATELNPAMFWFAAKHKDPSLLCLESRLLKNQLKDYNKLLPVMLIWGADINLSETAKPESCAWFGHGETPVALMRSSWHDPNAIFIGIKGGTSYANHAHMDIGSFVMESDGIRWAMDFGSQGYHSLESKGVDLWNRKQNSQRWQVFRYNNYVHNTLTVDNELQRVDGFAPLTGFSSDKQFRHAIVNLSDVYKEQLSGINRGIAIEKQKFVVIQDELYTLKKETTVRWTMLTSADVKITGKGLAELTKNGKKLTLRIQSPNQVELKTWSTQSPNDYDAPNPGTFLIGFEEKLPANSRQLFTIFLIPEGVTVEDDYNIPALQKWPQSEKHDN